MAKKRPRIKSESPDHHSPSKDQLDYWMGRLFKNTFTYKGRRQAVSNWSVKIQIARKRKCFSLVSGDRQEAALEACNLYKRILTEGWDAVRDRAKRKGLPGNLPTGSASVEIPHLAETANREPRLVHRQYPLNLPERNLREYSAVIEEREVRYFFPLGTNDISEATVRANQIQEEFVRHGPAAAKLFPRELTLAFRWLDDPVVWTYATIHTRSHVSSLNPAETSTVSDNLAVLIIDSDAGIRLALADCVNQQPGFRCVETSDALSAALPSGKKNSADLILVNQSVTDQAPEWERLQSAPVAVLYSTFEDSGQLFKATPSGAAGYMLKRTAPERIFDPIAGLQPAVSRDQIISRVREYFQRLSALLPHGHASQEMAKLTPRELEILALLSKGELGKRIADHLGISIWTVQGHIKSIFEKLNVHTRTEAVVKYLQK